MNLETVDLFITPFFTGLVFAVLLPLLGAYLRLRDEWLAALAYAHVAAGGVLAAMALHWPLTLGGLVLAVGAAVGKRLWDGRLVHGAAYPLILIGGWSLSVLLAANLPMAERLGHALFDGQLYFTDPLQLGISVLWLGTAGPGLLVMGRNLLLVQLFPDFYRARRLPTWPVNLGFDLLAAGSLALATMNLGVMGSFALLFIPPWLAFTKSRCWRSGLGLAAGLGAVGYIVAFALALILDQPFGPVLALTLITLGGAGQRLVRRIAPSAPTC